MIFTFFNYLFFFIVYFANIIFSVQKYKIILKHINHFKKKSHFHAPQHKKKRKHDNYLPRQSKKVLFYAITFWLEPKRELARAICRFGSSHKKLKASMQTFKLPNSNV